MPLKSDANTKGKQADHCKSNINGIRPPAFFQQIRTFFNTDVVLWQLPVSLKLCFSEPCEREHAQLISRFSWSCRTYPSGGERSPAIVRAD
jgi:hypothetical protein